jgi:hypothetical protein
MSKHDKLMTKVEFFHRLALFGKRSDFLKHLTKEAQAYAPVVSREGAPGNPVNMDEYGSPSSPVNIDQVATPANPVDLDQQPGTALTYPPVPKDVQNFLNELGFTDPKDGKTLAVDGKLGPKTRMALNWFKSVYQVPAGTSDQDLFETVRYHGQKQSPLNRQGF